MRILKAVKERGEVIPVDVTQLATNKALYDKYYDDPEERNRRIDLHDYRLSYSLPALYERNGRRMLKRQREFMEMSGGMSAGTVKGILPPDEYLVISLFYGLDNQIATVTAISALVQREDGRPSSRQWVNQLKDQAWQKIHIDKIKHIWGIPLFRLHDLLTEDEYEIMSRYWGIHTDKNGNEARWALKPEAISNQLCIPVNTIKQLIVDVESRLANKQEIKPILKRK